MKKTYIYILFGIMVFAQIIASAQVVYNYEQTIVSGTVYKFKTAPVDPNDPFRGKYIDLNFDINHFETDDNDWNRDEKAFLYISKDAEGFATLETLSKTKITNSPFDYVEVKIRSYYSGAVHFELPFNTYYMEETKAYDAELLYRKNNRLEMYQNVYAFVHIQNDIHVLTDVIINGISMKDAVKK